MDASTPIALDTWHRRQHFEHYRQNACTYSMTVELDATAFVAALQASSRKTYLAQIWALATLVNRYDEFRMHLDDHGEPAIWSRAHPAFTVFNAERETFSCVWAPHDPDFAAFHEAAALVVAEHRNATEFFPQGAPPPNAFDISSLPWASFTGFNLNIRGDEDHLAPIFTLGRYVDRDGRTMLPLAVQMNHAAADGFHVARLVNELQELLSDPSWVG
ncbi:MULTISPECIES: chloramphenicol acetyltransferase [unclassified Microbacterium]|uniref:chloramphenicol acetyltransferase n=1 Tax=unclassified Microbacterium TaxID=2609290 RepID=UPI00214C50AD|nr:MULTISPECIES: chloramphenicol acetyltransferase [unclassified Microbacterium]MCR2783926.1 chloramphenicol acetyltransferase [Microbacterium sp. zg.B96]WIM15229.1 chloramphenicol acetyltransferase [Microbacterium sp. zg-B96]